MQSRHFVFLWAMIIHVFLFFYFLFRVLPNNQTDASHVGWDNDLSKYLGCKHVKLCVSIYIYEETI